MTPWGKCLVPAQALPWNRHGPPNVFLPEKRLQPVPACLLYLCGAEPWLRLPILGEPGPLRSAQAHSCPPHLEVPGISEGRGAEAQWGLEGCGCVFPGAPAGLA